MPNQKRILVVDDDQIICDSLCEFMKMEGYLCEGVAGFNQALIELEKQRYNLMLTDVNLPEVDGFELLRVVRKRYPEVVTIVITGYGTIESAVEAIKMGAYDYLTKPIIDDEIRMLASRALNQQALIQENRNLKEQLRSRFGLENIIGHDFKMLKVFDLIEAVADSKATVLITGQSGTGKELIARAIHYDSSRSNKPLIVINCGAIPESLLESELFGHEKGSFTGAYKSRIGRFEMANGGTIFLDEVGNIGAEAQTDLLRVIETRQFTGVGGDEIVSVDFRLICATNRDLELVVKEGKFREDLYYKLNVFSFSIPPLRERRSDIPLLGNYFLKKIAASINKQVTGFSPEAMERLETYVWPGNVRELRNAVERAIVVAKGPIITVDDLPIPRTPKVVAKDHSLESVELAHIQNVLEQMGWNITRSAQMLGIDRVTLYNKMKKYGLRKKP